MNENQQSFISSLHMPRAKAANGKRVWSLDLETVVLPHLFATNTVGQTAIPHDALGAPIRLVYAKDGSVKFTRNGKPSLVVAKPIRDEVALMRENFIAHLEAEVRVIRNNHPDEYAHQIALAKKAGEPIVKADHENLDAAVRAQVAAAMAEAEKKAAAVEAAPARAEDGAPEREMVPVA